MLHMYMWQIAPCGIPCVGNYGYKYDILNAPQVTPDSPDSLWVSVPYPPDHPLPQVLLSATRVIPGGTP